MVKEGKLKKKDIKNDSIIYVGEDNLHYEKFQDGTEKCIEDEIPFEVPAGWEWTRIGSICIINPRNNISDSLEVSFVPMSLISEGYTNMYTYEIRTWSKVKSGFTHFAENDIGIAKITPCFENRKSVIFKDLVNGYGAGTTELHILRTLDDTISNEYLLWIAKMDSFIQGGVHTFSGAVGQQRVGKDYISQYLIPVPPRNEQTRIIQKINSIFEFIIRIENAKEDLEEIIRQAKSKILDLAIRGQLVPQDPNDEPASVLLERIRAEKEELIKQGKIKRDKKESIIFKGEDNSYYEKVGNTVVNIDGEIPFELPDGWVFVRLKEMWELISGRDLASSEYNAEGVGIPYITGASNFTNGKVELVRWTTSPQVITKTGDLLLTCKGTIGEMAFNNFGDAHIARQIMAIRNTFELNPEYLALCMAFHISAIKNVAKGLIPGISREDILNLILPVPPRAYQARVVKQMAMLTSFLISIEKSLN
nr:restriction endonuclease subunit S [Zhenpiania hominis]